MHRSRRRHARLGATLTATALLIGCQSYEQAPLDLDASRAAFDARVIESEPVRAFAERMQRPGAPPARFDPSDGISPAEGEVLALFYNPDLRLQRAQAGVALATFENAGLWDDPVFGFGGEEIFNPSQPFQYGLTLSLTIPISGRLEVEKDQAGAAYEASLRRIVDAEWATRAEVRRAWARWAAAVERTALLREVVAQVTRISSITDQLEAAGELSRVESRLFRVERADRSAALQQSELDTVRAASALLDLLGLPSDGAEELVPEFPVVSLPDVPDDVQRIIEHNTALAVRRAEYQVAEETLRLEVRKQYPDITIGSGYGSENRDDRLLLGLSMPIPVLNANRQAIAQARAGRLLARTAAETTFEQLTRDLSTARAELDVTDDLRQEYTTTIVPMLASQSDETERIAALGDVNTFLLLETVTRNFDAKSRLLELQVIAISSTVDITELLGPEEALQPSPVREDTAAAGPTDDSDRADSADSTDSPRIDAASITNDLEGR